MNTNPAQSVKAVEWKGKAVIIFDPLKGLVIKLRGKGKVVTSFDDVRIASDFAEYVKANTVPGSPLLPQPDMQFDASVGVEDVAGETIGPTNLFHQLRERVKTYFWIKKVEVEATVTNAVTGATKFTFPPGYALSADDDDAIRGIMGSVHYVTELIEEDPVDAPEA